MSKGGILVTSKLHNCLERIEKMQLFRVLTIGLILGSSGCASFGPVSAGPCRDSSTGRFISCGSGGGGTADPVVLGLLSLGALIVGGIVLLTSLPANPAPTVQPNSNIQNSFVGDESAQCRVTIPHCDTGFVCTHPSPSFDNNARCIRRVPLDMPCSTNGIRCIENATCVTGNGGNSGFCRSN
jgi:hypothetical protein